MLKWTTAGAMTDRRGYYSLVAPVGRHIAHASMMGYITGIMNIEVDSGDTVTVNFALSKDPNYDSSNVIVIPEKKPLVELVVPYSDQDPWPYDAFAEPIDWESLEFELRYVLAQQDDSVVVNVVAEGRNVTTTPVTVCGHFAFWNVAFLPSPDVYAEIVRLGGSSIYAGPMLEVSADKFVPGALECESVQVEPGESIARGMTFSFDPEEFAYWTGEVGIQCFFFAGNNGDPWPDVKRVYLGMVRVPIRPIGQTVRPRR